MGTGVERVARHSPQQKAERKAQRAEAREARRAARQARKSEGSASSSATGASSPPSSTTASTSTSDTSSSSNSSTSSVPTPASSKNFIGELKGATIVNFAVQGGQTGNSISVFASGEGPNAKKISSSSEKTQESSATTKVDTVA